MKKFFAVLLVVGGMAAAAQAQMSALITQGSSEMGAGGSLAFQSESGTSFDLDLRYAYFFWDYVSIGGHIIISDNDYASRYGGGVIAEYNFMPGPRYKPVIGSAFVPFVGGLLDYRHAKVYGESGSALVFGLEAGAKFFMTESAAIVTSLIGEFATDDIYANDNDLEAYDFRLNLGIRLYF